MTFVTDRLYNPSREIPVKMPVRMCLTYFCRMLFQVPIVELGVVKAIIEWSLRKQTVYILGLGWTSLLIKNETTTYSGNPFLILPLLGKRRVSEQAKSMLRRPSISKHGCLLHRVADMLRLFRGEFHVYRREVLLDVLSGDSAVLLVSNSMAA